MISRRVLAQALAHVLGLGFGYAAFKLGLHLNVADSAVIAAAISSVAGPAAGYLIKDVDELQAAVERGVSEAASDAPSASLSLTQEASEPVTGTVSRPVGFAKP